jgi:ABC-type lipoprotein release transport system permease subunit
LKNKERSLKELLSGNHILVGSIIAKDAGCLPGSCIEILIPSQSGSNKNRLLLDSNQAIISDVFKTGLDECDSSLVICSQQFFQEILPDSEETSVALTLIDGTNHAGVIKRIKEKTGLQSVYSWQDLYPALIAATKLETYAMTFIFSILILFACTTIGLNTRMALVRKQRDIALFKSFGAPTWFIQSLFLMINSIAAMLGIGIGIGLSFLLRGAFERYPLSLPDAYIVDKLPFYLQKSICMYTFFGILLLIIVISYLSLSGIKKIKIAKTLHSEYQ